MKRAISSVIFASVMAAVLSAQQPAPPAGQPATPPTPTFRSTTRLIVQTGTVKDKDGKPIEGLTAKDFIVTEDGEPQTIAFVEFQRLPPADRQRSGDDRRRGARTRRPRRCRRLRQTPAQVRRPTRRSRPGNPATSATVTAGCSFCTSI